MPLGDWDQLSELFARAKSLPRSEWESFVASELTDPRLRREVLSLLGVNTPTNDPLEHHPLEWLTPAASPPAAPRQRSLTPGQMIAGRFRILEFLGAGGMAEVYAAHDEKLGEEVALKLLHADLASQPEFLERFRREIRLARRISHPHVARVFDLVVQEPDGSSDEPMTLYVMEKLSGPTLARRLQEEGPIAPAAALELATQLAAGLSAAHRAGVIHRDFKPSNIILTPHGAVIADFGLAAPVANSAAGASPRTTSLLLGTPGYVAPEQWAGQIASPASDVYAFGVVLHEMITGRHPIEGQSLAPAAWQAVIDRCLAPDPKARWSSAEEAAAALRGGTGRRKILLSVTAITGSLALGAYGLRFYQSKGRLEPVTKLLLTPIQNHTGNLRFDGATEMFYAQLNQSPQIQLLPPGRQRALRQSMGLAEQEPLPPAKAREMAWRAGTPALLYAAIASVGPDLVINVRLETLNGRADSVAATREKSFRASGPDDLVAQVRAAAVWTRETAGEASAQIARTDRPPEDVTTSNWLALQHYHLARGFRSQRQFETAEQHLKDALQADPRFTMASRELADLWIQLRRYSEGFEQWRRTMALLESTQVTSRERYSAEAVYWGDIFEFRRALDASHAWTIHFPGDAEGYFHYGSYLAMFDRYHEADAAFEKSATLSPSAATSRWRAVLGWFLNDAARTDRALGELERAGNPAQYLRTRGQTEFLRGRDAQAEATFRELAQYSEPVPADQGLALLVCQLAETERWTEALAVSREQVARLRRTSFRPVLARRLLQQAFLELRVGQLEAARRSTSESASLETGPRHLFALATLYRVIGMAGPLEALVASSSAWPAIRIYELARAWVAAELALLRTGRPPAATPQANSLLRDVPAAVLPASLALGWGSSPPQEALKIWYMADHHWPGLSGIRRQKPA